MASKRLVLFTDILKKEQLQPAAYICMVGDFSHLDKENKLFFSPFVDEQGESPYYQARSLRKANNFHWGQFKLLLSEIEFIQCAIRVYGNEFRNSLILYVGAASGIHTPTLINMYTKYNLEWHLYDVARFSDQLKECANNNSRVKLFNQFFTHDNAMNYSRWHQQRLVFLISDIRSSPDSKGKKLDHYMQKTVD